MYARARFHGLPLASARVPVHMDTYEHTKMEFRFFFLLLLFLKVALHVHAPLIYLWLPFLDFSLIPIRL